MSLLTLSLGHPLSLARFPVLLRARAAMFAVNHWQLDQSRCLPHDAELCSMAAVPAAAGTACPGNLGAAGLGSAGLLLQMVALAWSVWCWRQSGLFQGCAAVQEAVPVPRAGGTGRSPLRLSLLPSKPHSSPFKASSTRCMEQGRKNRSPPARTAKDSQSRSLCSRNPEWEGGAGLSSRRCL